MHFSCFQPVRFSNLLQKLQERNAALNTSSLLLLSSSPPSPLRGQGLGCGPGCISWWAAPCATKMSSAVMLLFSLPHCSPVQKMACPSGWRCVPARHFHGQPFSLPAAGHRLGTFGWDAHSTSSLKVLRPNSLEGWGATSSSSDLR